MDFFSALNCEKFGTHKYEITFPEQLIGKVVQVYDGVFYCTEKRNVLYGPEDFKGISHFEILQWFHSNCMAITSEQTYKIIQYTPPEVQRLRSNEASQPLEKSRRRPTFTELKVRKTESSLSVVNRESLSCRFEEEEA
jgi:hypothetical protein